MKKLFLHIGNYKTGTTSIQNYLVNCAESLKERCVLYPEAGRSFYKNRLISQHESLASVLSPSRTDFPPGHTHSLRNHPEQFTKDAIVGQLLEEIEESNADTIIISSELFMTYGLDYKTDFNVQQVKELFSEFDVTVIVYLRRPDLQLYSWYNELVKTGHRVNQLRKGIKHHLRGCILNYTKALTPWVQVFGADQIIIRDYANLIEGDAIQDFMSTVGLADQIQSEKLIRNNSRLPDYLLEIKRQWNHICESSEQKRLMSDAFRRLIEEGIVPAKVDVHLVTPRQRQLLRGHAEEQEKFIAEHFGLKSFFGDLKRITSSTANTCDDRCLHEYYPIISMELDRQKL